MTTCFRIAASQIADPQLIRRSCVRAVTAGSRVGYNSRLPFVYILRCADGTLYTGYARDPKQRELVHNNGRGAKYTRGRRPVRLVYSEACRSVTQALKREHQLKRWTRTRKEVLIAGDVTKLGVQSRRKRRG